MTASMMEAKESYCCSVVSLWFRRKLDLVVTDRVTIVEDCVEQVTARPANMEVFKRHSCFGSDFAFVACIADTWLRNLHGRTHPA